MYCFKAGQYHGFPVSFIKKFSGKIYFYAPRKEESVVEKLWGRFC
jgi:hypothetical protein